MKILLIIIFLTFSLLLGQDSLQFINTPTQEDTDSGYPLLEATVGFGFLWLLQGNVTFSPIRYFYIQPRGSLSILASEAGISFGLQKRHEKDSVVRIGLGFSRGSTTNYHISESESRESWNSYHFSMGVLMRGKEELVYYPNINISDTGDKLIFSINITIGICKYR